jgi:hypothetical protein
MDSSTSGDSRRSSLEVKKSYSWGDPNLEARRTSPTGGLYNQAALSKAIQTATTDTHSQTFLGTQTPLCFLICRMISLLTTLLRLLEGARFCVLS